MKNRLLAVGWFGFLAGLIFATKTLEARPLPEIFTIWDKLQVLFVMSVTMLMGFLAGIEASEVKE